MKKMVIKYTFVIVLIVSLVIGSLATSLNVERVFVPIKKNSLKCSITLKRTSDKFPESITVKLTNITPKEIKFSLPKKLSRLDSKCNTYIIRVKLGNQKRKELLYLNFDKDKIIKNKIVTLKPNASISTKLPVNDFFTGMRCNIVRFNEFFKKSDKQIEAVLSVVFYNRKLRHEKDVVKSNSVKFNAIVPDLYISKLP